MFPHKTFARNIFEGERITADEKGSLRWFLFSERYYQYGGPAERNGYPRPVPQEPKKFECKHEYLMDPVKMPYKEKVSSFYSSRMLK